MADTEVTVYECNNMACALGSRRDPGKFSGGASQQLVLTITGDPNAPYGDGICPSCGEPGTEVGVQTLAQGHDPYQPLHDEIANRVADPDDPINKDNAQDALYQLVNSQDGDQ
jgi:hypothetical protein